MSTADNARRLVEHGFHLFTLDHPSLPTCIGRHRPTEGCNGQRGKHPTPLSWPRASTNDLDAVLRVLRRGPHNLAGDCGKSRLLILDEDVAGGLDRVAAEYGTTVPATFSVATGKGRHVYFRQPEDLPFGNRAGRFSEFGVDVRGRGGYIVAPGSVHESGRIYQVADWDQPILPVPQWVADAVRWSPPVPVTTRTTTNPTVGANRAAIAGVIRFLLAAQPGSRNGSLHWASCRLFERVAAGQLDDTTADALLLDAAAQIQLPAAEARATIRSARRTAARA